MSSPDRSFEAPGERRRALLPRPAASADARAGRPLVPMIWAQTSGGVIGDDGGMPWHLPEDFQHLKTMTAGCPIIMGRRTWESLPSSVRPLPGRRNMVITGDASRAAEIQAAGGETASCLAEAYRRVLEAGHEPDRPVWIFGGNSVYTEAISSGLTDAAVITVIDLDVDGDTHAPELDPGEWELWTHEPPEGWLTAANGLRYRFETRRRTTASDTGAGPR